MIYAKKGNARCDLVKYKKPISLKTLEKYPYIKKCI